MKVTYDSMPAAIELLLSEVAIIKARLNESNPLLPEWLNLDEACMLTGYKKNTIYKKKMLGEIPYYKMGKKLMFKRSELEYLIYANK